MTFKERLLPIFTSLMVATAVVISRGQTPPPTAVPNSAIAWDYSNLDVLTGPITLFLVCLDGQPTAACAQVPVSDGVTTAPGEKTYTWKLPPMLAGPHVVAVQACTAAAASCSSGATLPFTFVILVNPKNLRLSGG